MTKPFVPTPWKLEKQIEDAMRRCDADIQQARLAKEASEDARLVRRLEAEAVTRSRLRRWGV